MPYRGQGLPTGGGPHQRLSAELERPLKVPEAVLRDLWEASAFLQVDVTWEHSQVQDRDSCCLDESEQLPKEML